MGMEPGGALMASRLVNRNRDGGSLKYNRESIQKVLFGRLIKIAKLREKSTSDHGYAEGVSETWVVQLLRLD